MVYDFYSLENLFITTYTYIILGSFDLVSNGKLKQSIIKYVRMKFMLGHIVFVHVMALIASAAIFL